MTESSETNVRRALLPLTRGPAASFSDEFSRMDRRVVED